MWSRLLLSALILSANGYQYHNEPCPKYGCPLAPPIHQVPFVPAPPGQTPTCAKPGLTFCESLDQYPQQLIKFLIDKRTEEIDKFLRDESAEDFSAYSKKPDYEYGYDYPRPKVPPQLYPAQVPLYPQAQPTTLVYEVPLNATHNRYLPVPSVNPYLTGGAPVISQRSQGYQLRPEYQAEAAGPRQGPWRHRNSRGAAEGQRQAGRTRHQNPLLEFAGSTRNRAKRQSGSEPVSICPTRTQPVVPRAALNNHGNWMFVVNLEQQAKYSQLVRSEICMSDTCDGLCSLPLGYTSKCQQQYVQKRLVALEGSGNRLYTDVFWFPHGCMCQVTLDY